MRSSACVTLTRLCVRHVLCWSAFPLVAALGSTGSAADRSALFAGFTATMAASDLPGSCIIGYGSSPSRCGPPYADTSSQRPSAGYPRFRHDPCARDVAFDPGQDDSASHTGTAHVAFDHEDGLRSCEKPISWLNPTPHALAVYASCPALLPLTQHSLPGGLLGLTRAGLAPADRASFAWRTFMRATWVIMKRGSAVARIEPAQPAQSGRAVDRAPFPHCAAQALLDAGGAGRSGMPLAKPFAGRLESFQPIVFTAEFI
jgi:hypothetical protein